MQFKNTLAVKPQPKYITTLKEQLSHQSDAAWFV